MSSDFSTSLAFSPRFIEIVLSKCSVAYGSYPKVKMKIRKKRRKVNRNKTEIKERLILKERKNEGRKVKH